jgi:hypothetical protein
MIYPKGSILEGFANGKHFIFHLDKRVMYLGGQKLRLYNAPFQESEQFYISLKAAAEIFGYTYGTEPENNLIKFQMR